MLYIKNGAPEGSRIPGPKLRRLVLYPAELLVQIRDFLLSSRLVCMMALPKRFELLAYRLGGGRSNPD